MATMRLLWSESRVQAVFSPWQKVTPALMPVSTAQLEAAGPPFLAAQISVAVSRS